MFYQALNIIFQIKQAIWLLPYKIRSKRRIALYMRENEGCVRINIGSGSNLLLGWLNMDAWPYKGTAFIDASGKLPFIDESAHFINCEHLVEHLDYKACQGFFKECVRILQRDGALRITTPDLQKLTKIYLGDSPISPDEILTHHRRYHNNLVENICGWFNDHMRLWNHKFIFDEPTLAGLLRKAGFSRIIRCEYGESEYPQFRGIERHDEGALWRKWNYVMIFEAYK